MDDLDFSSDTELFLSKYSQKCFLNKFMDFYKESDLISKTQTETMIVHFYCAEFEKCKIMNRALRELAPEFPSVQFCCINVDSAPKMCECLSIKCLPFLGFFRDGLFVQKLVGFEELGNKETFRIEDLKEFIKNSYLFKDE